MVAALNQCDLRALLDGLQRRRHRSAAATDHGDLQLALAVAALVGAPHTVAHLVEQPSAVVRRWGIGEHRLVAESGHSGSQRVRCGAGLDGDLCRTLGVGHDGRLYARHFLQGFLDVHSARVAGHASDLQGGHAFSLFCCQ